VKGWPAVACFLAMWAAMFWAYKTSAKQEDRNPNQFVDWLLAAATVFAVLSVLSTRPLLFGGWYNEPLAISNLPHHLLRLPRIVEQSVGSGCYLLTVFASLRTLRELERRPRFALLFILNPTVLLVLFGHNDVFLLFAALAFSLLYLVRGKWWIASGLLGLSFGFGIIGLALLACLVKHLFARTAKDRDVVCLDHAVDWRHRYTWCVPRDSDCRFDRLRVQSGIDRQGHHAFCDALHCHVIYHCRTCDLGHTNGSPAHTGDTISERAATVAFVHDRYDRAVTEPSCNRSFCHSRDCGLYHSDRVSIETCDHRDGTLPNDRRPNLISEAHLRAQFCHLFLHRGT
jgi:hypothetical protein